jgi:hypothetical protein
MPNTKFYECASQADICLAHLSRPEIIEYIYGVCDAYLTTRKLSTENTERNEQCTKQWNALMAIGHFLNFSRDFKTIFEEVLTDMKVNKDMGEVKIIRENIGVVHHLIF